MQLLTLKYIIVLSKKLVITNNLLFNHSKWEHNSTPDFKTTKN